MPRPLLDTSASATLVDGNLEIDSEVFYRPVSMPLEEAYKAISGGTLEVNEPLDDYTVLVPGAVVHDAVNTSLGL